MNGIEREHSWYLAGEWRNSISTILNAKVFEMFYILRNHSNENDIFHEIMYNAVSVRIHILIHNPIIWNFGVKSVVKSTISPNLSIPPLYLFLSLSVAFILPFSLQPQAIKCIWFVNHIFIIFHLSLWFSSVWCCSVFSIHICTPIAHTYLTLCVSTNKCQNPEQRCEQNVCIIGTGREIYWCRLKW